MRNQAFSTGVKSRPGFADECCSYFAYRKRRTGPTCPLPDHGSAEISGQLLPTSIQESAGSVCDVEPLPNSGDVTFRKSARNKNRATDADGSSAKSDFVENTAKARFNAAVNRFQEVAGDQVPFCALVETSFDHHAPLNAGDMAWKIEQCVIQYQKERRAEAENRNQRGLSDKVNTFLWDTLLPLVQGFVNVASAVASVHQPSLYD